MIQDQAFETKQKAIIDIDWANRYATCIQLHVYQLKLMLY